jgi:short-subunit dehydrogenase
MDSTSPLLPSHFLILNIQTDMINIEQGVGIARILASHGDLAVALLARRSEPLHELTKNLRSQVPNGVFEAFPTDTSPASLSKAFKDINDHASFKDLKLRLAIFSVKHSSKKPFMEETYEACLPFAVFFNLG